MNLAEIQLKPGSKKEIKGSLKAKTAALRRLEEKLQELQDRHDQLFIRYPDEMYDNEEFMEKIRAADAVLQEIAAGVKGQMEQLQQSIESERVKSGKSNFIAKLESECSEYLAMVRETQIWMFRGMHNEEKQIFMGMPRNNRNPMDSSHNFQLAFDRILKAKGFIALRSNSIFCTSSYEQAENYGHPFFILPINGFSYTWSQTHDDVQMGNYDLQKYIPTSTASKILKQTIAAANEYGSKKYKGRWETFEWNSHSNATEIIDVEEALEEHFRGLTGNGYTLSKVDLEFIRSIGVGAAISPALLLKDFKPTNKNFQEALRNEHEIYIHGPYYAVDSDLSADLCRELGMDDPL